MFKTKKDYYLALLEVNHLLVNFKETPLKISVSNSLSNELIKGFYKLSNEDLSVDGYIKEIERGLFSVSNANKTYLQENFPSVF